MFPVLPARFYKTNFRRQALFYFLSSQILGFLLAENFLVRCFTQFSEC